MVELALDLIAGLRLQVHCNYREVRAEDHHELEHLSDLLGSPLVALLIGGSLVDLLLAVLYQLVEHVRQALALRQLGLRTLLLVGYGRHALRIEFHHTLGGVEGLSEGGVH